MKYLFTYLGIDLYLSNKDWSNVSILWQNEFWKPLDERYIVSSLGRIKDISKDIFLKQYDKVKGYFSVSLSISKGMRKTARVHRLVAKEFIQEIKGKDQVNHKNGIRKDNRFNNLEWVTNQENVLHGFRSNGRIQWTARKVINMNTGEIFETAKKAHKNVNMPYKTFCNQISGINTNKTDFIYLDRYRP